MAYSNLVAGKLFGVLPVQLVVFVAVAAFVGFLLSRTTYGPKLYMLGTSERAARFSGLKNDRLLIKTYLLSGVCAALGGLVMLANYNSARADYGAVYTLQCVLIVVLGGVSPTGGKGRLSGVLLAIVVLQILSSGLNRFSEINPFFIPLIWAACCCWSWCSTSSPRKTSAPRLEDRPRLADQLANIYREGPARLDLDGLGAGPPPRGPALFMAKLLKIPL